MEISAQPLKDKVKKAADAVTGGGDAKPAKAEPQVDVAPSNFNTQALWPVGIVASGAGIYALSKADSGFNELLVNAVKVRRPQGRTPGKQAALGSRAAPQRSRSADARI